MRADPGVWTEDSSWAPPDVARVVLVGFMASGKSTVGRHLAELLDWDFVDFDDEIERRTGRSIGQIFRTRGEAGFRALEAELTRELAGVEDVVMAPGGGWVTQPELLDLLGPDTLVVWLRVTPEEAVERARRDATHRPLLAGAERPLDKARRMIEEREPLYRMADVVVDVDGRDARDVAREIAALLDDARA